MADQFAHHDGFDAKTGRSGKESDPGECRVEEPEIGRPEVAGGPDADGKPEGPASALFDE